MRKQLLLFAGPVTVALVLGLVVYVLPASGTSTSLVTRVTRLEATTKALKTQNTKLATRLTKIEGFVSTCLVKVVPAGSASTATRPPVRGTTTRPTTGRPGR